MVLNRLCHVIIGLSGVLLSRPLWAQGGLAGTYYRGINFDQKVQTRTDLTLDFDWSTHPPLPGLEWSYYSIRWTGGLWVPASGRYRFYCGVDDGIRLWVGQQLVIDEWHLTPYRHFAGQINLVAGRTYPIRIDYFNDIHGGRIDLRWDRPDQPGDWFSWLGPPGEIIPTTYLRPPARPPSRPKAPATTRFTNRPNPGPRLARSTRKAMVHRWTVRPPAEAPVRLPSVSAGAIMSPPLRVGPLTLLFAPGSHALSPVSRQQLDSMLVHWRDNPPGWIEIVGHADRLGDRALNRTLSEYRARVVIAYLTQQGMAPTRLRGRWHGDEQPLTLDSIPVQRALNRRTLILSHYD